MSIKEDVALIEAVRTFVWARKAFEGAREQMVALARSLANDPKLTDDEAVRLAGQKALAALVARARSEAKAS